MHVWYYDLDDPPLADHGSCLDAGERERADRLYRERDRLRFRAAHCAFRHLVAGYLGCDPAAVTISRECPHCGDPRHGKPAVSGPPPGAAPGPPAGAAPAAAPGPPTGPPPGAASGPPPSTAGAAPTGSPADPRPGRLLEVNASHSDALGALAVALPPLRVGVDVERRRENVNWAGILPDPAAAEPPGDGFEEWTRLEAVAKAAGTGIVRLPRLSPPGPDGWAAAGFPAGDPAGQPRPATGWQVRSLAAPDGYAAALAVSSLPAAGVQLRWHR